MANELARLTKRAARIAANAVELAYAGKESELAVLAGTAGVRLQEVERYGEGCAEADWRNMLVHGDNRLVLKALMHDPAISGGVSLVYIDPPFSTNQDYRTGASRTATVSASAGDAIAYSDQLNGAAYLDFLRARLILLKQIMAAHASIYVHIDCKVGHYVRIIMDEVFGRANFINEITRIKCNPKNFARRGYGNVKDVILFYSKGKNYTWNGSAESFTESELTRLFPKVDAAGRRYTTTPLHAPGETRNGPTGLSWKGLKPPRGRHWRYPPQDLFALDEAGLIEWSSTGNPRKKIYADECAVKGRKRQDIWEFKDPCYPDYPTEKNFDMLKAIIKTSSNPGDIVLDCFGGSGTTALAAQQCGRRWVAVDRSPAAIEVMKNRLAGQADCPAFVLYRQA